MKLDRSPQEQASTPKHTPKDVGPKSTAPLPVAPSTRLIRLGNHER